MLTVAMRDKGYVSDNPDRGPMARAGAALLPVEDSGGKAGLPGGKRPAPGRNVSLAPKVGRRAGPPAQSVTERSDSESPNAAARAGQGGSPKRDRSPRTGTAPGPLNFRPYINRTGYAQRVEANGFRDVERVGEQRGGWQTFKTDQGLVRIRRHLGKWELQRDWKDKANDQAPTQGNRNRR